MGENGKKEWILMVVEDRMQFEEITFSLCVRNSIPSFQMFQSAFFLCEGTVRTMIIMSNGRSFFYFSWLYDMRKGFEAKQHVNNQRLLFLSVFVRCQKCYWLYLVQFVPISQ